MNDDIVQPPLYPENTVLRGGEWQQAVKPIKHGFYATYSNHGCRCADCKAAHAEWHREYRRSSAGRQRTVKANRKSRRIQQESAVYLKNNHPDAYAMIVQQVNESLQD